MIHEAPNCTVKDLHREGGVIYLIGNEREETFLATIEMPVTGIINNLGTNKKETTDIQPTILLNYHENKHELRNPPYQNIYVDM